MLVVERIVQPPNAGADAKFADLMMFALAGGRERTKEEFAALLDDSGFALGSLVETNGPVSVIEALPA